MNDNHRSTSTGILINLVTAVAVVKDKIDSVRESHQKKTQTEN